MSQERNKFFFEEKRANAEEEIVDEYDEDVNVSFEFCEHEESSLQDLLLEARKEVL